MTLYLLKVHLQTFVSRPIIKKCQNAKFCVVTLLTQMLKLKKKGLYLDHTHFFSFRMIFAVNSYCFLYSVNQTVFVMEQGSEVGIEILNVIYTSLSQRVRLLQKALGNSVLLTRLHNCLKISTAALLVNYVIQYGVICRQLLTLYVEHITLSSVETSMENCWHYLWNTLR